MKKILFISILIHMGIYALESPVRWILNMAGADQFIFLRDALIIIPTTLYGLYLASQRQMHPAYIIFVFVIVFHGGIMILNLGEPVAVIYMIKALFTFLAGAVISSYLLNPSKKVVIYLSVLFVAVVTSIVLEKYFINFPWSGLKTELGDIEVSINRNWDVTSGDKRAAGLMRSSIHAATFVPVLGMLLLFSTKRYAIRTLVCFVTLLTLYLTTQKGSILAFFAISSAILILYKNPLFGLKLAYFTFLTLMIAFPIILPFYDMPQAEGQFSLYSFNLRVEDMWPEAWWWIRENEVFPFGVGLGGIGGPQRFYAPDIRNAADNMFLFLYANFGVMAIIYLALQSFYLVRVQPVASKTTLMSVTLITFIAGYGIVLSIVEDPILSMFWGASLACLAAQKAQEKERA